jgi:hypothetical protein
MTVTKFTNEQYLRAEHLLVDGQYKAFVMEIAGVLTDAPLQRKLQSTKGLALKFAKTDKVLGLGQTNESLITVIAGDSRPEKWVGLKVRLEVRKVRKAGGGGTQPAIRIIPPVGTELRSGLAKELGESYETAKS